MSRALTAAVVALASLATAPAVAQRCEIPRVLLTVDRSSSMLGAATDGLTKWQAAEMAIGEVATAYEGRIDLGLQVFPFPNRCEPGAVVLDFAPHAGADVVDALGGPPPDGGNWTPMAQTLDAASAYLGTEGAGVHMILVTDGWQWCDPYSASTRYLPVAAVERLRAQGVTVHVVGFGASVDALTLNRTAVAAGTAIPGCDPTLDDPSAAGHCYTQVGDLSELRAALESVARLVTDETCDGIDSDCDGLVDEGFDVDADGYTTCGTRTDGGTDPTLVDCDDDAHAVHPGAPEICNLVDDDCDGMIDPDCACTDGDVVACGSDVGACMPGTSTCVRGRWDTCADLVTPRSETCDGTDENCDGTIDNGADCDAGFACNDGHCVELVPETPETPVEPTPDDLTPHDPMADGEDPPSNLGGCACTANGAPAHGSTGLALLGAALALVVARRRR
jgi:MYXO-CTERM domain-containing protein